MAYQLMCEVIIVALLAIICFLLYKLYKIKYTGLKESDELIPGSWKKELSELDDDKGKEFRLRFQDIDNRISGIERKVERIDGIIERLIKELG